MSSQNIDRAVLLVLDHQRDVVDSSEALHTPSVTDDLDSAASNIAKLVGAARSSGRPVVWVRTERRRDGLGDAFSPRTPFGRFIAGGMEVLVEGTSGVELYDGALFDAKDIVVTKSGHSAFQFSPLDRILRNLGADACVVAGGALLDSLADTVRQGGALGYWMIIATDATGYRSEASELRNLANRAIMSSTVEICEAWRAPAHAAQSASTSRRALILVDLQNDFVHERGAQHLMGHNKGMTPEQRRTLLRHNQQLIAEMRRLDQPVIHVVTTQRQDLLDSASPPVALGRKPVPKTLTFLLEGSWGAEIVEELAPQPDDFVIRKAGRSAFGFTPLHRLLRNLGVSECLVTGGGINGCVEDTVREGSGLGYRFTVVSDATYEPGAPFAHLLANRATIATTVEVLGRASPRSG